MNEKVKHGHLTEKEVSLDLDRKHSISKSKCSVSSLSLVATSGVRSEATLMQSGLFARAVDRKVLILASLHAGNRLAFAMLILVRRYHTFLSTALYNTSNNLFLLIL